MIINDMWIICNFQIDAAVKEANKTVSTKKLKTEERLNTLYRK